MTPAARAGLEQDIRTLGFRNGARGHLLRVLTAGRVPPSELTLFFPVLAGRFRIAVGGDDLGVGRHLLDEGVYEPHVAALYRTQLRPGMTVLDVGANIGFHALHAATRVAPHGRVVAVEPDPGNAALLRASLRLNEPRLPVEVVEAALSDADGELILSDLGNAANSGARFTHRDREVLDRLVHGRDPQFRNVRALRWDAHHLDTRLDFVKIDVEGHEPQALRGMEQALLRYRPTVLSEFAPANLRSFGAVEPEAFLAWWGQRGYAWALVDEPSGALRTPETSELLRLAERRHHLDLLFTPAGGGK